MNARQITQIAFKLREGVITAFPQFYFASSFTEPFSRKGNMLAHGSVRPAFCRSIFNKPPTDRASLSDACFGCFRHDYHLLQSKKKHHLEQVVHLLQNWTKSRPNLLNVKAQRWVFYAQLCSHFSHFSLGGKIA